MTPDLLEGKETVLNESVAMRIKTVDFPEKVGDKVADLFVIIDVTPRVEVSKVEEGNVLLVSFILLSLEVWTSFAVVVISVVLSRAVEIRGLEVKSLVADEGIELADSEARLVTVRLRDGNAVTLKIDLAVDPSGDDNSEINFGMEVDATVTEDGFGRSVVTIDSAWKLEARLLITLDVTSKVTLGATRDVEVIITLDVTVDTVLVFVLDDLITDVESSSDNGTVETTGDGGVTSTDESETRVGVTLRLIEVP